MAPRSPSPPSSPPQSPSSPIVVIVRTTEQKKTQHYSKKKSAPPCVSQPHDIKTKIKGSVMVLTLDRKYKRYPLRECRVENLCGHLCDRVDKKRLAPVLVHTHTCMGWQDDIYTIHGNGSFMRNVPDRMFFKGCQGIRKVQALAREVALDPDAQAIVHMAVVSGCIGTLVDVRPDGLMENILLKLGVDTRRLVDTTNSILFTVDFARYLPQIPTPRQNEWSVTTRGSVIVRLTWDRMAWTEDVEHAIVDFCNRYMRLLGEHITETPVASPPP
jgi:hypothetical protein